ncbi:PAS domain S-box protein [Halovenus halobia]|uniref:PAS domain S-box protein n=1 Tax=Halovenus halobia TaxID=3396622 RepID=UPI003F57397E
MSEVQVLIGNAGEREAVVALLAKRYEVRTGESVEQADLYLIDDHSVPAHREALREQKRAAGAVFCPVVLVRRERTRIDEQALPGQGPSGSGVIDEVITAPLDYETVVWRLDNLLTRRDTTRNLVEKNERLQQRERELQRYQTFVERSSDIITVLDESGVVKYQSPAIERVLGYGQDELIGENAFELFHPEDRPELEETYAELIADPGRTVASEGRIQRADGEYCWLSVMATNHFDSSVIDGIVVNSRDISDRKYEQQRRERTVERMTDAILDLNENWRFIEINDQAEQILGIESAEVLGKSIWDIFPSAVDTRFYDAYTTAMNEREPVAFEERFDEMDTWFEVNAYPEPHGGISVYFRDITDRKAREHRIERLNREFETVFENVRDGLFLFDRTPEGTLIFQRSNAIAGQLLSEEILTPGEELDGRVDPVLLERARECLEQERTVGIEHRVPDDGDESVFDVVLSPVIVEGTAEMVVGSARDVTERRQYEQQLESQRDDLRLLNQMVRHDIRNDLQVIQTHGELLAAEVSEELRSSADSVVASAKDAISLTEEARDLAAVMLRSGDTQEPISLSATLRTQVQQAGDSHDHATIEIDGTIPSCEVSADDMLDSVFDNLLQNSVVHNDSPEPRTVVSASIDDEYAVVRVADNGPGIDDDQREAIFEKGQQGEASEGTGVGLYLVRTLIEGYGGSVDVEESAEGGAAFVVRLPLAD